MTGSAPRFAVLQNDGGASAKTLHLEYRSSQNTSRKYTFGLSSKNIWDNQWHHIVFTTNLTSRQVSLYIDGVLHSTVSGESDSGSLNAWPTPAYIGARNNAGVKSDEALSARIAEVAWYNKRLSAERIAEHFNALSL